MIKMNSKFGALKSLALSGFVGACSVGGAQGALVMNFSDAGGGNTRIVFSGTDVVTGHLGDFENGLWTNRPDNGGFAGWGDLGGSVGVLSGSGTLTGSIVGSAGPVNDFWMDADAFGIRWSSLGQMTMGETITWSGDIVIATAFSNFQPGYTVNVTQLGYVSRSWTLQDGMVVMSSAAINVISQEVYAGFTDYGVETIKSYTKAALSMPGYSNDGSARSVRIPVGTSSEPVVSGVSSESVTSIFAGYTHYSTGTDSSINGADYDIRSNGGIVGVRHEVRSLMLGGFLGVDEGKVNSSTLDSNSDAFLLGAIASYTIKPEMNLIVTGGITYGSYEFSGTRATAAFDDVGSDVFDIHVGLEGDAYAANNIRVTPFVGFHYIYSDTEAFNETGPGALSVDAHDYDAFFSEIGVKAEYQLTKQVSLNGNLSYTHNLSGSEKNIGASLGGTPFAVASPGLGNDFFTIGIGAQYQVTEDVRLGINYRAEFSTDAEVANGVNIGGSYSF